MKFNSPKPMKDSPLVSKYVGDALADYVNHIAQLPDDQKPSVENLQKLMQHVEENARTFAREMEAKGVSPEKMAAESTASSDGLKGISHEYSTYEARLKESAEKAASERPAAKVKPEKAAWRETFEAKKIKLSERYAKHLSGEKSLGQGIFTQTTAFVGGSVMLGGLIDMVKPKTIAYADEQGNIREKKSFGNAKKGATEIGIGAAIIAAGLIDITSKNKGRL